MRARADPHVPPRARVELNVRKSEEAGLILLCPGNPLNQGLKLEWGEIQPYADFLPVLLHHGAHLSAYLRTRVRDQRKLHHMAIPIAQSIPIEPETILIEKAQRFLEIVALRTQPGIYPKLI